MQRLLQVTILRPVLDTALTYLQNMREATLENPRPNARRVF